MPKLEEAAVTKEFSDSSVKEAGEPKVPASARRLFRISSVFPLQLFPDEIVVDEFKVTIITRVFFFDSGLTRSILYRDLSDVAVEKSLWFAALKFGERGFPTDQLVVNYLWRDQAERARRLIEGMIVLDKEKTETAKLSVEDLFEEAEKLGREKGGGVM